MVSFHQSDADADQNKTRFLVVWICIFDSSYYSRKIVVAKCDLWRMDKIFLVRKLWSILEVWWSILEVISHFQPEFLERHCRIISFSVSLLVSLIVVGNHY